MKPTDLKCRPQVVAVIGEALADYELGRVIDCKDCDVDESYCIGFSRDDSPQGYDFWRSIGNSINPYDHGHEKPSCKDLLPEKIYFNVENDPACKSVTMPDWVPADLDNLDYRPEVVAFNNPDDISKFESGDKVEPTAASILESGLGHMKDRAVTYDNPQGERSMGKTVDMFNILYGLELTEEQGWAFMAILKLVRTSQGDFKLDNFEDLVAYAGLMGESAAKG